MQHGVTEELLAEVASWRTSTAFTAPERAALDFAERFVTQPQHIDAAFVDALRTHFDDGDIVDLAICVGKYLGIGRVVKVLELDHTCPVP